MKKTVTVLSSVCVAAVGLALWAGMGSWWQRKAAYPLPPQERVRQQFETHKTDFLRFAELLRKDQLAQTVNPDGTVDGGTTRARQVPEYRDLMRKVEAKFVTVREDGSMEFELWGSGCAICSDSYMGVRYFPNDHRINSNPGWTQTAVASLDEAGLPHEKGAVATGLYVVPIEPDWYVYRLEYRE